MAFCRHELSFFRPGTNYIGNTDENIKNFFGLYTVDNSKHLLNMENYF